MNLLEENRINNIIEKIVSGGQAGVDQGGLFAAKEKGILLGGWCPKGGLDETGYCVLNIFPLKETQTNDPNERTKLNIQDSDGTLIIVPCWPLPSQIQDGTLLTISHAEELGKPRLIADISKSADTTKCILEWIYEKHIRVMNIAGPRESTCPGIQVRSYEFFKKLFLFF